MRPEEIILWAVVLLIGVPSAWRNPTAGALVIAAAAARWAYLTTGAEPDDLVKFVLDIAVLAIIFSKPTRTPADWTVVFIYPVEWVVYGAPLHNYYSYWLLWDLSIAQFLMIFAEAVQTYHTLKRDARVWMRPPPGWFSIPGRTAWGLSN